MKMLKMKIVKLYKRNITKYANEFLANMNTDNYIVDKQYIQLCNRDREPRKAGI